MTIWQMRKWILQRLNSLLSHSSSGQVMICDFHPGQLDYSCFLYDSVYCSQHVHFVFHPRWGSLWIISWLHADQIVTGQTPSKWIHFSSHRNHCWNYVLIYCRVTLSGKQRVGLAADRRKQNCWESFDVCWRLPGPFSNMPHACKEIFRMPARGARVTCKL